MSINTTVIKPIILACVILLYWFIGYYPVHPLPEFDNNADLKADEGLIFPAPGIAYTRRAPAWLVDAIDSASLEIMLEIQPATIEQTGPARILTISSNTGFRNLTIGQQGKDLVVRVRRSKDTYNGTPAFVVSDVFTDLGRHALSVAIMTGQLKVTIDDAYRLIAELPANAFDTWARDYRLAMGNEITFDRPWLGTIYRAIITVDGKAEDYLVPGAVEIPTSYYLRLQPDTARPIPFYHQYYSLDVIKDWVINLFGFMPLGALIVILFPGSGSIVRAVIICLGVSLVIEAMQMFLPWRHPGIEDLILNTLGGAVGAWLGCIYILQKGTIRKPGG